MSATLLYATEAYRRLRDAMVVEGAGVAGAVERTFFPDGERYLRLLHSPDGADAVIVGGTISDSDTLEVYDLACAAVDAGAQSLTLVVPYYGHSTMERAVHPGEAVTAKTRARLLSSLPAARLGNRIVLVDLHTEGIPYYFEGGLRVAHVYAKEVTLRAARELGGADFVLACTDAGRAKWVESLANDLGVTASFVFKRRVSGDRTEVLAVSAQVKDRDVVIYDDMIRTGGSLLGAARAYLEAGARSVSALATHGLFPGDAFEKIMGSGTLAAVACSDSHPRTETLQNKGLRVYSIAGLLARFLREHAFSKQ